MLFFFSSSSFQETERLVSDPVPGITAVPHEDNLRYFDVTIDGPAQSPYEGGVFRLELFLPEDYPSTYFHDFVCQLLILVLLTMDDTQCCLVGAPKVRFITKIYHPNIDRLGRICLDILKSEFFLV